MMKQEMIKQFFIVLFSIAGLVYKAQSQDTLTISQPELIQQILDNNLQVKAANKQVDMARADYSQSNALFLPSVTASHTAMFTNNPLMAFGSKLNQEILTPADFDPNLLNNPSRIDNYATEIQVLQPLFNLDGTYERQAAKIQSEAYELQVGRTKEYLELEGSKAYMQLQLAYKVVEVLEKAENTSSAGLTLISDYYDEGLVQKTDVLAIQVRKREVENQLRQARSNIRNVSDYLSLLMGEKASEKIYKPAGQITAMLDEGTYLVVVPTFRKDLNAMSKSVEGYEKILKSNKVTSLPRINAFGSYQLYDNQPFGFGANGYLVGVRLSWNLFNGYKNIGKIHKAKAELEKAQIEKENYQIQSQLELNKAYRQLADAEAKVTLSKEVLNQSTEAYRIRKDRFAEGLEKTTDVLASETQMFQKELEYLQAMFEYNFTKEYLRFLTR
ncbi:MAG: TolC family protein [Ekhidna sp.]